MLLWFAEPFALIFWLVGSSALIILGHAAFIEPPVSSEYAGVEVRPVTSDTSRVEQATWLDRASTHRYAGRM